MLIGYPIKITMKTIHVYEGKLYLGEDTLYFFPNSTENALKTGVIRGLHKASFDLHTSAKHQQAITNQELPENATTEDLETYLQTHPNALKFEADKIDKIQQNWVRKVLKYNGKNHGLPDGLSKELKQVLKPWAEKNNVEIKGF